MSLTFATFEHLVRRMSPAQLFQARRILEQVIEAHVGDADQVDRASDLPDGRERRRNQRFNVVLQGTLRPLIPGKGEQDGAPISILDVSKDGMRFVIGNAEALYPITEITFTTPSGRIRSLYAKLVRTRLIRGDERGSAREPVTEVAAQAIDASDLATAQQRHRDLVAATKRIPDREQLPIILVGKNSADRAGYETVLGGKGHPLVTTEEMSHVSALLTEDGPELVVYADGAQALLHREIIAEIRQSQPMTAQIAVIRSASDRRALLGAGIDECVHSVNAKALMVMYVDRAIRAKMISTLPDAMPQIRELLIHAGENMALAQLGSRFDPDRFRVVFAHDVVGMIARLRCTEVDALLVELDIAEVDDWDVIRNIRAEFPLLQVLVAVSDPRIGPDAIVAGASDYLLMPITARNAAQLITAGLQAAECEAAMQAEHGEENASDAA